MGEPHPCWRSVLAYSACDAGSEEASSKVFIIISISSLITSAGRFIFIGIGGLLPCGSSTQTTTYYAVEGKRVAADVNGTFYYFGYDVLGSQVAVLDANGNLVGSQLYGPYGASRYSTGTLPTSIGFTGQRADSVTGLDYYLARYYDPVVGQFLSVDGVQGNAQGTDPYAYVGGDPETRIDPTGHRFTQVDAGGGGPAVDDPTGFGQLFSDVQNYLNNQNPFLSFAEEEAAIVTAPVWVPVALVVVILSIPSDSGPPSENSGSRRSNQSQNTSVSPTPEATPTTDTNGVGARCFNSACRDLNYSEKKLGHTLKKHVNIANPQDVAKRTKSYVSQFTDSEKAQWAVDEVLKSGVTPVQEGNYWVFQDVNVHKSVGVIWGPDGRSLGQTSYVTVVISTLTDIPTILTAYPSRPNLNMGKQ